jgi:hypothetical protein
MPGWKAYEDIMEAITIGDKVVLGAKNCYEHKLAVETYAESAMVNTRKWRLEGYHVGRFVLEHRTMTAVAQNEQLLLVTLRPYIADYYRQAANHFHASGSVTPTRAYDAATSTCGRWSRTTTSDRALLEDRGCWFARYRTAQ